MDFGLYNWLEQPWRPNFPYASIPKRSEAIPTIATSSSFPWPVGCQTLRYQTLVKFDIDSVIAGKTINRAILRLYPFNLPGDLHLYYDYWACGTPQWPPNTATWNNNAQFHEGTCDQAYRPTDTVFPVEWDMTTAVQQWADGTLTNGGFIVWEPDYTCYESYPTLIRITNFESLEVYDSLDRRPQLYIEWE